MQAVLRSSNETIRRSRAGGGVRSLSGRVAETPAGATRPGIRRRGAYRRRGTLDRDFEVGSAELSYAADTQRHDGAHRPPEEGRWLRGLLPLSERLGGEVSRALSRPLPLRGQARPRVQRGRAPAAARAPPLHRAGADAPPALTGREGSGKVERNRK